MTRSSRLSGRAGDRVRPRSTRFCVHCDPRVTPADQRVTQSEKKEGELVVMVSCDELNTNSGSIQSAVSSPCPLALPPRPALPITMHRSLRLASIASKAAAVSLRNSHPRARRCGGVWATRADEVGPSHPRHPQRPALARAYATAKPGESLALSCTRSNRPLTRARP